MVYVQTWHGTLTLQQVLPRVSAAVIALLCKRPGYKQYRRMGKNYRCCKMELNNSAAQRERVIERERKCAIQMSGFL